MVVSLPAFSPFLMILFGKETIVETKPDDLLGQLKYYFSVSMLQNGRETTLLYICMMIATLFFFRNVFRYLALYFIAPMRNGIVADLRQAMYEKITSLPIGYFTDQRKGDLLSRITNDVQEVEWSILNVIESVFREPLILISSLAFMIFISPHLTLFVIGLILFIGLIISGISKTLRATAGLAQSKLGVVIAQVEETLGGLRIIKAFQAETYQNSKFRNENEQYRKLVTKVVRRKDLASPLSEFLGVSTVMFLLWYGSRLVFNNQLSSELFMSFLFAFYNVIDPVKNLSSAWYNIQKGRAAIDRIEEVLDTKNNIVDVENPIKTFGFEQQIEYKNVSFCYPNSEKKILDNVSFIIPKGKVVALVGASGAGKSTIADLLPRFYDVNEGQILVDNIDIRQIKLNNLRNLIGIVSQEAILFNDSIENNIIFGKENKEKIDVESAAKVANAHEFIIKTELGYETNIGDRGSKLSGGQRQRLTIARAVFKDPPILIFDEATSSLDSESEQLVQQALNNMLSNKTAIIIAHRLSTIQNADLIIVLNNGKILEQGTHESLIEKGGEYKKLVSLQQL